MAKGLNKHVKGVTSTVNIRNETKRDVTFCVFVVQETNPLLNPQPITQG